MDRLLAGKPTRPRRAHGLHEGAEGLQGGALAAIRRAWVLGVPFAGSTAAWPRPQRTMIIAEAFGRALAIEPYLATVVLAAAYCGTQAIPTPKELGRRLWKASWTLALAHQERQARFDLADVATRHVRRQGLVHAGSEKVVSWPETAPTS